MTSSAFGAVRLEAGQQVLGVLPRVEAEGLVVEPDDRVVRRDRRAQEALAVLVDAQRAEPADRGGERPVDEQQQPDGSVLRQVELVEGLELAPLLHVDAAQVDEARTEVVLHLVDGLLEDRRRHEAEHQRLRRALREIAEQAPGAPLLRVLDGDLEPRGAGLLVEGPRAHGRVHRQVPGVDAVALEEDHRVLTGRYVDLQLHLRLVVGRLLVEALGLARRQVDPLDLRETCVLERRDERVLAGLMTAFGAARQVTCPGPRGRLRVVRRGRGDPQRAPREGPRHDVNSPPRQPSARACQT